MATTKLEVRHAVRQPLYWIYASLLLVLCIGAFAALSYLHNAFASFAGPPTYLGPRFLIGRYGVYPLVFSLIGLVFLGWPRTDDPTDALDTRPTSNVLVIAGRVAGLACIAWIPLAFCFAMIQAMGAVAQWLEWPFLDTIEGYSLSTYLFVDVAPAILAWCSFVVLLHVVSGNRLVASLTAILALMGIMWTSRRTPTFLNDAILPVSNYSRFASDIVPQLAAPSAVLQRLGMLLGTAGLVAITAVCCRRRDGNRRANLVTGTLLGTTSAASLGIAVSMATADAQTRADWFATHAAAARQESDGVDVEQVRGYVRVTPGNSLYIDVGVVVRATEISVPSLVFSLNPNMEVDSLRINGHAQEFDHHHGLLRIELEEPLSPHDQLTVSVVASGIPDCRFAYLDGVIDPGLRRAANRLWQLGDEAAIFDPSYVALMPGVHWLPTPGASIHRDDPSIRTRDFFEVDLAVDVPEGWLASGPGGSGYQVVQAGNERLERALGQGYSRFRFRPSAVVSEVGIFASQFRRIAIEVDGVTFELLLHATHADHLDFFADAGDALRRRLRSLLSDTRALGLPYPYARLSVVEVPAQLRTYRGGWRTDTAFALPGVLLLKEVSLVGNNQRFDTRLSAMRTDVVAAVDQKVDFMLRGLFYLDEHGAALGRGLARNLALATTSSRGSSAATLNYLMLELADWLLNSNRPIASAREADFSAHSFDSEESFAAPIGALATWLATGQLNHFFSHTRGRVDRPPVWEQLLARPLADLARPYGHFGSFASADLPVHKPLPQAIQSDPKVDTSVLILKSKKMAKAIIDSIGRGRTAEWISEVRRVYEGRTFDLADFLRVGASIDAQISSFVQHWIEQSSVAGFVTVEAEVGRLDDSDSHYRTTAYVRNDQPAPGLLFASTSDGPTVARSSVARVEPFGAVVVEVVTTERPEELWLHTHLALNRHPFRLNLRSETDGRRVIEGAVDAEQIGSGNEVIIDDLDARFFARRDFPMRAARALPWWLRPLQQLPDIDQGLPEYKREMQTIARGVWLRESAPGAWGKYRRTLAIMRSGDGAVTAEFSVELPSPGRWRLGFHVPRPPKRSSPVRRAHIDFLGPHRLTLQHGNVEQHIDFDALSAQQGWNDLGTFDIGSRRVSVIVASRSGDNGATDSATISNRGGDLVIADAIRWSPEYAHGS